MPIATVNPATGETVRTFAPHTDEEVEARLARADRGAELQRQSSFAERGRRLTRAAELLTARRDELARLATIEMGKLHAAGLAEIDKCALACRYYAENGERHLADEIIASDARRSLVRYQPLGVVLAVMPWNFPFWQVFRFAATALMAGNAGLLKHASNVPQTALTIEGILREAGFPEGALQTLLIEASRVEKVIEDPRIKAVTLTGSEGAGRSIARVAGTQLKKTVLELGGSDPFVVMPSADLDKAVATAVTARIQNAGQSCIAAKRFILHERIADRFEKAFVEKMAALRVGDPNDPRTEVGPLAMRQVLEDVEDQVRRMVQKGSRVLAGGKRLPGPGFYFAPTVLTDAGPETPGRDEEIFGPVATLFRVVDLDEAIQVANATKFGLGASAWTQDPAEAERLSDQLDAGQVFINGMVKSDPRLPFGGVKASGYGRELSEHGIREFTNVKTIWMG